MAMLLGKKIGMTQMYDEADRLLPVTVIQAGPCIVMQVKTADTDGYNAIQLGYDDVKKSRRKNSQIGHAKKANSEPKRFIREMHLPNDAAPEYKAGDALTVAVFEKEKFVDIVGTSKGKGFAGVMKRYDFHGMPGSHGTERKHRSPGSIASHATDRGHGGNLHKGKRMAGHLGDHRATEKNHSLVAIDQERNLLMIKGCVPGACGGYVVVRSSQKA
ncbi:MAG: 50S ribosomal protein L3 [Phycisphaerae bacterium]|nr:50S ribosomal protein L3 [Phycisphaerae bacterium]MDD5381073.1 50S ribosomal protein L3 [Phycisphaerae bacterium]